MPELLTFAAAKNSLILKEVSGVCSTSEQFRSLLNEAVEKLMNRGSFWGTVQRIQVCTYGGCITWPRFVGTVLAMNLNGIPSAPKNAWYDFLPISQCDFWPTGSFPWISGSFSQSPTSDGGLSPVFNQIACGHPVYLRIYPSVRADVGKQITIYGVDSNGLELRTLSSTGAMQLGETITLALPYTQTATIFRNVTRISKPVTQGVVRYYQWSPVANFMYDLVWHDPGELEPVYRVSKLPPGRSCCLKSIDALVKLEFTPVVADTDIVQIPNIHAIKLMMQSLRNSNAENQQMTDAKEMSAVRELNLELRKRFPVEQTVTRVDYFGRGGQMPRQAL